MYAHTHVHIHIHKYIHTVLLSNYRVPKVVRNVNMNPCTYIFHNVGTFSIMQLGPERGVGVAIAKAVATKQQDCGTCINWEIVYLNF